MRKKLLIGIGISIVISLILVLTRETSASRYIQGISQNIFQFPKAALYGFSVSSGPENEYSDLEKENAQLRTQLVEVESLKQDNAALKSQFEEQEIDSSKLLPATIVGFHGPMQNPDTLVIDRGARDELKKGQAVIQGKNLVGVILDVSSRYSTVLLVTNPKFSTVAKTSSDSELGVAQGAQEYILLDNVAITSELEKGEMIISRGTMTVDGVGIPPELILGEIESIRKIDSEPFQSARVKSLVNTSRINQVFIMQ